jgi:hypothetical protein
MSKARDAYINKSPGSVRISVPQAVLDQCQALEVPLKGVHISVTISDLLVHGFVDVVKKLVSSYKYRQNERKQAERKNASTMEVEEPVQELPIGMFLRVSTIIHSKCLLNWRMLRWTLSILLLSLQI